MRSPLGCWSILTVTHSATASDAIIFASCQAICSGYIRVKEDGIGVCRVYDGDGSSQRGGMRIRVDVFVIYLVISNRLLQVLLNLRCSRHHLIWTAHLVSHVSMAGRSCEGVLGSLILGGG